MTPMSPNEVNENNEANEGSSAEISFTHFITDLKADNPPNNAYSLTKSKAALPLSRSALSVDFLAPEHYISPHDISISMGKEIEVSKNRNDKLGENKSSKKPQVARDYSQITNINDSKIVGQQKPEEKCALNQEKSVKLSQALKGRRRDVKEKRTKNIEKDRKKRSPIEMIKMPNFQTSP